MDTDLRDHSHSSRQLVSSVSSRSHRSDRRTVTIPTADVDYGISAANWDSDGASLSSIPPPSNGSVNVPNSVKEVYRELQDINDKLKNELRILNAREAALKEKELLVTETQASFDRLVATQAHSHLIEKDREIEMLREQLREKGKENKRIKENFDTLKLANDTLHKELEVLQAAHNKLEKQHTGLQGRVTNLQRKQEYTERKTFDGITVESLQQKQSASSLRDSSCSAIAANSAAASKSKSKTPKVMNVVVYDMITDLLEWVSETSLRQSTSHDTTERLTLGLESALYVQDKCLRVLPQLLDVIRELSSRGVVAVLTCLQFVYWSIIQLDLSSQGQQKATLPSTLRRLGEELYCPRQPPLQSDMTSEGTVAIEVGDRPRDGNFLYSPDMRVRFLSSLVILKTVNQVDRLAHVFDVLRCDLKTKDGRDLFLRYRAMPVILSYVRPANKTLTNASIDLLLQLCADAPTASVCAFVEACSSPTVAADCLQKMALLWRAAAIETHQLEKVSILLQKLSKVRSNRKYFEMYGISTACPEIMRSRGKESEFLTINIKSILYNLNVSK